MVYTSVTGSKLLPGLIARPPTAERWHLHSHAERGNDQNHLFFEWRCAYPEIGALWLTVYAHNEIILSCEITHTHFSCSRYIREKLTNLQRKRRIARDAVQEARRFLRDEIAATITYAPDGSIHSYGWCPTAQLASSHQYERKVFGEGITRRAWTWQGEVTE